MNMLESNIQSGCTKILRQLKIKYRLHNKSKSKYNERIPGWSDITLFKNKISLFVEIKCPGEILDPDQKEFKKDIEAEGFTYIVCYSVEQFLQILKDYKIIR